MSKSSKRREKLASDTAKNELGVPAVDREFLATTILKEKQEKEKDNPKMSYFQRAWKDGVIHFFVIYIIFAAIIVSYGVYVNNVDQVTPIVIKLKVVNNYTNYVKDECGYYYEPINPRLTNTITVMDKRDAERSGKGGPSIVLNESNIYEAVLISRPLDRMSHQPAQISQFKLAEDQTRTDSRCLVEE